MQSGLCVYKCVLIVITSTLVIAPTEQVDDLMKIYMKSSTFARESPKKASELPQKLASKSHHLTERWSDHSERLTRVHWNTRDKVAIYFDRKFSPNIGHRKLEPEFQTNSYINNASWLYEFVSQVWSYMTQTYGNFGPDPYLHLIIHQGQRKYKEGAYHRYSIDSQPSDDKVNILDINSLTVNAWQSSDTRNNEMDTIIRQLAYFVENSSKDRWGSPSFNVWKGSAYEDTAWVDIFTYDVYTNLNLTTHASRHRDKSIRKVENSPNEMTFWFKNWFLPIYTAYGGNSVLNEYFKLLHDYIPHRREFFSQNLSMGSFVHFWSGAARTDLKNLATLAFGWNATYEEQYEKGRLQFPGVADLYSIELADNGTETESTTQLNGSTVDYADEFQDQLQDDDLRHSADDDNTNLDTVVKTDLGHMLNEVNVHDDSKSTSKSDTKMVMDRSKVIIGGSTAATVILVLVLGLIASFMFYKKKIQSLQTEISGLTTEEVNEFFDGNPNLKVDEGESLVMSMPFIRDYEIPREKMILDQTKILGTGQFGSVLQGFIRLDESDQMTPVALKTVKANVEVMYFKAFLSEVKIMAYLGQHENIVKLLGTCTAHIKEREIFIALEYCPLGNLQEYLKRNRNNFESISQMNPKDDSNLNQFTVLDLLKWSQNIANAMMYLTQKKVIHGDLAARNVLLTENRVAKISDFGLSRQFLNYANYMKTSKLPVPWRWLAIESLKEMKFSTASDVWAFGVTIWEIFSLAETPYGCWTFDLFFADKLINGDRLLMPACATNQIYQLMKDCWNLDPNERPKFQQIFNILQEYLAKPLKFSSVSKPRYSVSYC